MNTRGKVSGLPRRRYLATLARDAGLKVLIAVVLPANIPMLKVFEKSGLRLNMERDAGVVHVTLQLFCANAPAHMTVSSTTVAIKTKIKGSFPQRTFFLIIICYFRKVSSTSEDGDAYDFTCSDGNCACSGCGGC